MSRDPRILSPEEPSQEQGQVELRPPDLEPEPVPIKKRRGRPPGPQVAPELRLSRTVLARVTETQHRTLERAAWRAGLALADWARRAMVERAEREAHGYGDDDTDVRGDIE